MKKTFLLLFFSRIRSSFIFLIVLPLIFFQFSIKQVYPFSKTTLAVIPFSNQVKNPVFDWLRVGIAETISNMLSNTGKVRVVERIQLEKVMKELNFQLSDAVSESSKVGFGEILGAQYLIIGNFQIQGDQIWIQSRILRSETAEVLGSANVLGNKNDIFKLQMELSEKIIKSIIPADTGKNGLISYKNYGEIGLDGFKYFERARMIVEQISRLELNPLRNREFPQYMQALDYLEKILETNPDHPIANLYMGILYLNMNDNEKAEQFFKKCIAENPNSADGYFWLANFYRFDGNNDSAKNYYIQAVKSDPSQAYSYYGLALIYQLEGDIENTMNSVIKAIEKKPDFVEANFLLNSCIRGSIGGKNVASYYRNLLDNDANSPEANLILGLKEALENKIEQAGPKILKSIQKYPDLYLSFYYLGQFYSSLNQAAKAIEFYKNSSVLYPTYPESNAALAKIMAVRGQCEEARKRYKIFVAFSNRGESIPEINDMVNRCKTVRGGNK